MQETRSVPGFTRWPLVLVLLALLLLLVWLFPRGDRVQDVQFDALGRVASILTEENRVVQILFQAEGAGDAQAVDLSLQCRVVDGRGKVSAHDLSGRRVKLHFAPENKWRAPERPAADLIFVLPS